MFEVGDLVTIREETFAHYVRVETYEQWATNPYGIVVAVEPLDDSYIILVKIHFQSLGSAYWLRSHEVEHVSSPKPQSE